MTKQLANEVAGYLRSKAHMMLEADDPEAAQAYEQAAKEIVSE